MVLSNNLNHKISRLTQLKSLLALGRSIFGILCLACVLSGCDKDKKKVDTSELEKAFQAAKANSAAKKGEVTMTDSLINDAISAIKKNENEEGVVILQMVRSQGASLSPDQLIAVQDVIAEAQKPLIERAAHGDPAALAAMERIRMGKRRH
ncbi:MAG: hypothetical protein JWM99_3896, partial [Verrucomicrobiales bacterium]|nr:hypothetical protein [Verrucomicrobiales bacterium]